MTIDAARYLKDALAFYREEIVLDTGAKFGQVACDWQLDLLRAIETGERRFAWIEAPRGFAKTSILAMVALKRLILGGPGERIYAAAGDRDQARLLSDEVRGFARRNPRLGEGLSLASYRVALEAADNVLEVLSADAPSSWGLKPSMILVDEVTTWRTRDLFDSLLSSTGKMKDARFLGITNAGVVGSWSWDLREALRADEDWLFLHLEPGTAPWIEAKWIESQRRILPPPTFARVILNQWGTGEGNFFTAEQVAAAEVDPAEEEYAAEALWPACTRVAVGVDLALRHDVAAVAAVGVDEEGRMVLLGLDAFQPVPGQEVDFATVEARIVEVHARWRAAATVFDPWNSAAIAQRIGAEVGAEEFHFSAASKERLAKALYERVAQGLFRFPKGAGLTRVDGQTWDLGRELRELQHIPTSSGFKFDHNPQGYDDRTTAVSLAIWRLAQDSLAGAVVAGLDAPVEEPADDPRAWGYGLRGRRPFPSRFDRARNPVGARLAEFRDLARRAVDDFNRGGGR